MLQVGQMRATGGTKGDITIKGGTLLATDQVQIEGDNNVAITAMHTKHVAKERDRHVKNKT